MLWNLVAFKHMSKSALVRKKIFMAGPITEAPTVWESWPEMQSQCRGNQNPKREDAQRRAAEKHAILSARGRGSWNLLKNMFGASFANSGAQLWPSPFQLGVTKAEVLSCWLLLGCHRMIGPLNCYSTCFNHFAAVMDQEAMPWDIAALSLIRNYQKRLSPMRSSSMKWLQPTSILSKRTVTSFVLWFFDVDEDWAWHCPRGSKTLKIIT